MQRPPQSITTLRAFAFSIVIAVLLGTFVLYVFTPARRNDCPVRVDGEDETSSNQLSFSAKPTDYQNYSWRVSTGEIQGANDTPSITVVNVGTGSSCTATVTIRQNDCQNSASHTTKVVPPACPTVSISCPSDVDEGQSITFGANIPFNPRFSFNWSVSAGQIKEGQGTAAINVNTAGLGGKSITATLEVGGNGCSSTTSCTTNITARPIARKTDEFAQMRWSEERERLQSYATQLQNEPGAQGYIVVFVKGNSREGRRRVSRLRTHLVNTLNIEAARVIFVEKETNEPLKLELWIVPNGAPPPSPKDRP